MQELGQCEDFVVKITQNTLFLAKNTPSPDMNGLWVKAYQELKLLMEDLGTLILSLP